jgi:hypothetical protein
MYILSSKCLTKCLNELYIDFFHVVDCVNMTDNSHRLKLGREPMIGSAHREIAAVSPPPEWGRGA